MSIIVPNSSWKSCPICKCRLKNITRHMQKCHQEKLIPKTYRVVTDFSPPVKKKKRKAVSIESMYKWLDKVLTPRKDNPDCRSELKSKGGGWHSGGE